MSEIRDSLDLARELLDAQEPSSPERSLSVSVRAIAHLLLWSADQERDREQRLSRRGSTIAEAQRPGQYGDAGDWAPASYPPPPGEGF